MDKAHPTQNWKKSWSISRVLYVYTWQSFIWVWHRCQPQAIYPKTVRVHTYSFPIWSCSRWGLPCRLCYQSRGALLPHHFTLTCAVLPRPSAVMLSVPLSVASRRPAVSRHSALRSPDFPPRKHVTRRLSGLLMCVPIITQTGLFLINANWDLPEFNIATQQKRLYLNDAIYCYFFIKIIILFHKNKRKICW